MRRKDRETDQNTAWAFLDSCEYAVLTTINQDGTPYSVPISPALVGNKVYFHGALEGKKLDNIKADARVCLCCVGNTKLMPEQLTTKYESCVVDGIAQMVEDEEEKREGLRAICQKYSADYMDRFDTETVKALAKTSICRITVTRISGKCHR